MAAPDASRQASLSSPCTATHARPVLSAATVRGCLPTRVSHKRPSWLGSMPVNEPLSGLTLYTRLAVPWIGDEDAGAMLVRGWVTVLTKL